MLLENRVVLVTGAGQGIGQAIALRMAEEGADIALNDIAEDERTLKTCEQIESMGRKCTVVAGDISKTEVGHAIVSKAVRAFGRLHILVNNAGLEKQADFLDVSEEDYDLVQNVNLKGAFFLTQAFAAHLKSIGQPGKVINISSVHEELPFPKFTPYCMSKGGMKMMTRSLALELAPLGITVNSIAPGAVETPMNKVLLNRPDLLKTLLENIPLRRLGQPSDVASVAVFLASDNANYITGTSTVVDGGLLWNYSEQ